MLLIEKYRLKAGCDRLSRGLCRSLAIAMISTAFMGFATVGAAGLDSSEVQAVVTILEELSSETGDTVFYDEEAADEWFLIDDESSKRIPAAGFTRRAWKEAFDQTMTGFIASIPRSELEEMMEEFVNRIGEITNMTPEQKQEAADALRADIGKLDAIRERGAPYQDVVSPYAQRLRKIALEN